MDPTFLTDYIRLAFRLGHMSATLGEAVGDEELIAEWQDDIDALGDRMEALDLPESKMMIISFLEQVGDITQHPELLDVLTREAEVNLERLNETIRRDAAELRDNPGTMPAGVRDLLTPRLLDALPTHAREEYEEAKANLLAGTWTSAVRCACVAVEAALGALYSSVTGRLPRGMSWSEMEQALNAQGPLDGKHPIYIVGQLRDIQKNYRNPTAHPERRMHDDEAYSAFFHCVLVLRRISEAIINRTMPDG